LQFNILVLVLTQSQVTKTVLPE